MARIAIQDGVMSVVATPHGPGSLHGYNYRVDLIHARLAELREALAARSWPLEVLAGSELRYSKDLVEELQQGHLLPCGEQRAVLLECPNSQLPAGIDDLVFQLQVADYRVVLAHPERIKTVQQKPDVLLPLINRGVFMQLTTRALTGEQGTHMQKLAQTLLTHHMVHLIASDGHDTSSRRSPHLMRARRHAAALIGEEAASALVKDTPAALLSGKPVTLPEPQPVQKTRHWFRWR